MKRVIIATGLVCLVAAGSIPAAGAAAADSSSEGRIVASASKSPSGWNPKGSMKIDRVAIAVTEASPTLPAVPENAAPLRISFRWNGTYLQESCLKKSVYVEDGAGYTGNHGNVGACAYSFYLRHYVGKKRQGEWVEQFTPAPPTWLGTVGGAIPIERGDSSPTYAGKRWAGATTSGNVALDDNYNVYGVKPGKRIQVCAIPYYSVDNGANGVSYWGQPTEIEHCSKPVRVS